MIKVLVLSGDNDGVGYFQLLMPHLTMDDPDFSIDVRLLSNSTLPIFSEDFIKQYDILFYNKVIPYKDDAMKNQFMNNCRKHNVKIIYDIDDYFILDSTHLNYKAWKQNNSQQVIEMLISDARYRNNYNTIIC